MNYEMIARWKASSVFEWTAISTLMLQEIQYSCFLYFLDIENLSVLADHEMFDEYSETQYC